MNTLNLGILAHVDAGKTTLTERLLFEGGAIAAAGSVDAGTTQTDSLALERRRGITIRTAVAAFAVGDVQINLIDTPGHPDFIAEVERSLAVLDGVVLVISAVEGVQAQTVVLMRALRRLDIPTVLFVNKIDRAGADPYRVLTEIRQRLIPSIRPRQRVIGAGRPTARVVAVDIGAAVDGPSVFFGSATTGTGVRELIDGVTALAPSTDGDPTGPLSAIVFKTERDQGGRPRAYVRLFGGTVRLRQPMKLPSGTGPAKVTALSVCAPGGLRTARDVSAGNIAVIGGLRGLRVGDRLGDASTAFPPPAFPPPIQQAAVVARHPADQGRLHVALTQLAEQDPLIDLRQDDEHHELVVSLYGEVQKEVLEATLAADHGIEVDFRESRVICRERPARSGTALRELGPANPFPATVGLRIEPAAPGSGLEFRVAVSLSTIPLYVFKSVDAFTAAMRGHVEQALRRGLSGWPVQDCLVTLTDSGYQSPNTTANDLSRLTPLVLREALVDAGTVICFPVQRFRLDVPTASCAAVLRLLARARATSDAPSFAGDWCRIDGEIDAEQAQLLSRRLAGSTGGQGALELRFDRFEPRR